MLRLFIFLVLVIFKAEASLPGNGSPYFTEITFTIEAKKNAKNIPYLTCDHNDDSKQINKYTVLEGGELKIITNYDNFIYYFSCRDYSHNARLYNHVSQPKPRNMNTFTAEKNMGTLWNCTVLTNRDTPVVQPMVLYEDHVYSAAYCYMQIHVRQTDPPQMILVNNMALQAVRTDLWEKDVDFTAEYQYVDGDVVNVACINLMEMASLKMEYPMADTLSDKFTSGNLSSSQAIGFYTKLHSGHNNSYMICTDAEPTDYTKVMVRFVMRTEINIVRVKMNGLTLRPKPYNMHFNLYKIEYKYISNLPLKLVCEVVRADMELVMKDSQRSFFDDVYGYNKTVTELKKSNHGEMSFELNGENTTLYCGADYRKGGRAELIAITFSEDKFPIERPPHMKLPPTGTVMQLYDYDDNKSRNAIFYEFEDGERLQLKCGPLHFPQPGPIVYLQFKDSICIHKGCYVTQNLTVTDQHDNSEIVCRLMELSDTDGPEKDSVLKEIRVILRKRVLTTITTTTTTTATTVQPTDRQKSTKTNALVYSLSSVGVLIIVVVLVLYLKARKPCCYRSRAQEMPLPRPDPASVYYENTLAIFAPINEREAEAMENHYEEIQ